MWSLPAAALAADKGLWRTLRKRVKGAKSSDGAPPTALTPWPQLLCTCYGAPMMIVRRRMLPSFAEPPTPELQVNPVT